MENKLQQLTRQLYEEGIQKAEIEAAAIIQEARQKAETIINQAQADKQTILQQAQHEATQLTQRTHAELRLVINQALQKLKQDITQLIQQKAINQPVAQALHNPQHIAPILLTIAANLFTNNDTGQITVQLSPDAQNDLLLYLQNQIETILQSEPVITINPAINAGFKIGKTNHNYLLSFTDEDFSAFITQFMHPEIVQIFKEPNHE